MYGSMRWYAMSRPIKTPSLSFLWSVFLVLLCMPLLLRFLAGYPLTPFDDSYAHLMSVRSLYDVVLEAFPIHWLFPLLLGLASFVLLRRYVVLVTKNESIAAYALILFLVTPLSLTIFIAHTVASLFFLLALALLLAYEKKQWLLASLFSVGLLLADAPTASIVLIVLGVRSYLDSHKTQASFFVAAGILIAVVLFFRGFTLPTPIPLFAEFGSAYGYSLFVFLLGVISVIRSWKRIDAGKAIAWLILFLLSYYFIPLRPLVLLPLILYASHALVALIEEKWSLGFLKRASLLLLVCLGLFVTLTHVQLLSQATPQAPLVDLAQYMATDPRQGAILATYEYDDSLRYFSHRDIISISAEDDFYDAVSLGQISEKLTSSNVRFILITPQMKKGEVWRRDDQGLLFLMHYNEKFINVQEDSGYQVWLVLHEYVPR